MYMLSNIVPGYKGVMPLDLSGVDPKYHQIMITQHKEDIKEYNRYQECLPTKLKYENSTEKAIILLQKDKEMLKKKADKKRYDMIENDKKYYDRQQRYLQYLQIT